MFLSIFQVRFQVKWVFVKMFITLLHKLNGTFMKSEQSLHCPSERKEEICSAINNRLLNKLHDIAVLFSKN